MKQYKIGIMLSLLAIMIAGLLMFSYQDKAKYSAKINELTGEELNRNSFLIKEKSMETTYVTGNVSEEIPELTDSELQEIMDRFIDTLVQDIDDQYKVIGISTKAELYELFTPIAKKEAVEPYISFYYHEEEDGLYIVPTELPPWFVAGVPYITEILDERTVKISQDNYLDIYGSYRIEIKLVYDQGWKITKIDYPSPEHDTIDSNDII